MYNIAVRRSDKGYCTKNEVKRIMVLQDRQCLKLSLDKLYMFTMLLFDYKQYAGLSYDFCVIWADISPS